MNDEDRKKVFWLLKKYSSYTAWAALGEAYAKFVEAWEYAMRHAEEVDVDNQNIGWTKKILDGQIAFEKGLPLLREGERSVFRRSSTGYLRKASSAIGFIARIMDPEEFVFDWMKNKDEVVQTAQKLLFQSRGFGTSNEPGDELYEDERVASLGRQTVFDPFFGPFNFPLTLPEVPSPTDTTVNTGEEIPITGIWEPEWEISAGFIKSLMGTSPHADKGCMNYLLAGSIAPKYKDGDFEPQLDVTWRLIWADHRYEDGTIPEEEKDYLAETPEQRQEHLRGLPGELVPKTGWWQTPALQGDQGLRYFNEGERFPTIQTTEWGNIIWGYDPNQQKAPPRG